MILLKEQQLLDVIVLGCKAAIIFCGHIRERWAQQGWKGGFLFDQLIVFTL